MEREARLKFFVAAAKANSITRAAEQLAVSQPAVSRQIKLLEHEMGCRLFRRHGRGIALSDNGQRLFDVVSPAFNRIDAVVGQIQLSSKSVTGQLRIASAHTLNTYFVVPLLRETMREFPGLSLKMLERSSFEVGHIVERGLADVGLAYDTMIGSEMLSTIRLHDENMYIFYSDIDEANIIASMNKEESVELHSGLNFIAPPVGYALRQLTDQYTAPNTRYSIEVETITLMLDAVRNGMGVCILPGNMPTPLIEGRGLKRARIANNDMSRTVVLVTRHDARAVPAVAHIIDEFKKAARTFKS